MSNGSCDGPTSSFELWVAEAVGHMLLHQSAHDFSPSAARFRDFVREQVKTSAGSNRAAFCRAVGFDRHGLNGWLDKHERPSITQFLAFCYGVKVMPPDMFGDDPQKGCEQLSRTVEKLRERISCSRPTSKRRRQVKELLEESSASADCRPVTVIAADVGVTASCLRYWFPALCKVLSERHRVAVKARVAANQVLQRARVQAVVRKIPADGRYPSRRRVNSMLHREHICLALPHLLDAYVKTLQAICKF